MKGFPWATATSTPLGALQLLPETKEYLRRILPLRSWTLEVDPLRSSSNPRSTRGGQIQCSRMENTSTILRLAEKSACFTSIPTSGMAREHGHELVEFLAPEHKDPSKKRVILNPCLASGTRDGVKIGEGGDQGTLSMSGADI
jgi:hypothetical protein